MIIRPPQFATALAHRFDGPVIAGAPMVVAEGEQVVLAHLGSITRIVGTGSYQVPAEFAGEGVEAWFVTTRPIIDIKFGGPLNVGGAKAVYGSCTLQVVAPDRLVSNLVGQRPEAVDGIVQMVTAKLLEGAKASAIKGAVDPAAVRDACMRATAPLRDLIGVAVLEIGALTVQ